MRCAPPPPRAACNTRNARQQRTEDAATLQTTNDNLYNTCWAPSRTGRSITAEPLARGSMVGTPRAPAEEGDAEKILYSRRQRELLESAATGFLARATRSLDSESPAPPAHWQREQLFIPRKPASGAPSPRLRYHVPSTNEASTTSRGITKLSSLKRGNGTPTGMSCSLDSIMEAYAEHRNTLDRIASDSGVRNKADSAMSMIAVGDKCEVFSTQANDWENATVIAVDVRTYTHLDIACPTTPGCF